MTVIVELCLELRNTMIIGWEQRQLFQVAQEEVDPQSSHAHKGGQVCPVNVNAFVMECRVNQPEDVDDFDGDNPHGDARYHVKIALGVA